MTVPDMDGRACLRALKKLNPDVKVILSISYSLTEAQHGMLDGAVGFIEKPYRIGQLSTAVRDALSNG